MDIPIALFDIKVFKDGRKSERFLFTQKMIVGSKLMKTLLEIDELFHIRKSRRFILIQFSGVAVKINDGLAVL